MHALRIALPALFLAFAPGAATAASVGDELLKFGLIGVWAHDCTRAADGNNPYVIYEAPGSGPATRTLRMKTKGLDGVVSIDSARVADDGRLEIAWTQKEVTFRMVFAKDGSGRYRSVESVGSDGRTYIRDGRFANDDAEVQWFTKCQSPPS